MCPTVSGMCNIVDLMTLCVCKCVCVCMHARVCAHVCKRACSMLGMCVEFQECVSMLGTVVR